MKSLFDCRLYAFVDTAYLRGRAPRMVAQQLCDGGADLIQLRAKQSSPDQILQMAETILPVTRRAEVGLVINDQPEIARRIGADLCHLGQEDFFQAGYTHVSEVARAGSSTGRRASAQGEPQPPLLIGLSTHSPDQAGKAIAAAADYIAVGPVFPTGTKPTAKPLTLEYVRWAVANVKVPWFAIGGINLANLDAVLAAGAQRICVVSAILNADDVMGECRKFRDQLKQT